MIQRIQTLWMLLTAALVCVAALLPVVSFAMGGADFRLMSYGITSGPASGGGVLVLRGAEFSGGVMTSTLSVCAFGVLVVAALVPFVSMFLFRHRGLQARLLGAEFAFLIGGIALLGWHVWSAYSNVVSVMSENYFFSFFPLLLIVALLTDWFALKGVLRDEMLVRAADRLR